MLPQISRAISFGDFLILFAISKHQKAISPIFAFGGAVKPPAASSGDNPYISVIFRMIGFLYASSFMVFER